MRRDETLTIGPHLPGAVLRVLIVAVAVTAAGVTQLPVVWFAVISLLALFGALLPVHGGAWLAAGLLVVMLVVHGPDGGRAALTMAAVHALQVLGALSLVVPATASVSLRALLPTALRFAVVQGLGQLTLFAVVALPSPGSVPLAAIAGAFAAVLLAGVTLRLLGRSRLAAFSRRGERSPSADPEPGVGGRSYT